MSERYASIETLFKRNLDNTLDYAAVRSEVHRQVRTWIITEKVDGMNMRVEIGEGGTIAVKGRSDNAQIPSDLKTVILDIFMPETVRAIFEMLGPVTIYGEGYGPGIKGSEPQLYRTKSKGFRAFDVNANGRWLSHQNFLDFVNEFSIPDVPVLGVSTGLPGLDAESESGVDVTRWMDAYAGKSLVASFDAIDEGRTLSTTIKAEGVVARPIYSLTDEYGNRVMWKLCWRDVK